MRAKVSQIEPAGARVGVIESHREPERDRERQWRGCSVPLTSESSNHKKRPFGGVEFKI